MNKILLLFLMLFIGRSSFAQPELVSDFNAGEADGMDEFNFQGHYVGDVIVLPIIDAEAGLELGVLQEGELRLLADLNPGAAAGNPRGFVTFDSLLYFIADDAAAGEIIWSTDGTPAGTQQVFTLPSDEELFWNLIASEEAGLFFTTADSLYRSEDGVIYEGVLDDVEFRDLASDPASTYCLYEGGIAFLRERRLDDELELWAYTDTLERLAVAPYPNISFQYFGLSPVTDGLIFSLYTSIESEETGIYGYVSETEAFGKLPDFPGVEVFLSLSATRAMVYIDNAFYAINSAEGSPVLLESNVDAPVVFSDLPHASANGKAVFVSDDPFAEDVVISQTTGIAATTTQVAALGVDNFSNFMAFDRFVFFANGTFNGFEANIFYVDTDNAEMNMIYAYPDGVAGYKSVQPVGIQDGKLYFASAIDGTVGRELYALETGIEDLISSTAAAVGPQPELQFAGDHFTVVYDGQHPAQVQAYDLNGRLVKQWDTWTNQTEQTVDGSQLLIYVVKVEGKQVARKYFH